MINGTQALHPDEVLQEDCLKPLALSFNALAKALCAPASPILIVQAQLDAYNAKDLDALMHTYAADAEHFTLHGEQLAKGHEQLRQRFQARFQEPNLHARLLSRVVVGNIVTDSELITRNFPEGLGVVEMLCIYEVTDGHIQRASFALGEKVIYGPATVT